MKVLFTIQHPAHVHLFRNAIKALKEDGVTVKTVAREKDINIELLEAYNIEYGLLAGEPQGSLSLPFVQLKYEIGIINTVRKFIPDILVGMCEPGVAHAGAVTNTKSIVFTDTEHATLQNKLTFPFVDHIYTPECYEEDLGEKQIRYPGYHELAYLHPGRFEPDPSVVKQAGVDPDEKYVILRLVSWEAVHDVGYSGFDDVIDVVRKIEETGARVLITSEADLPEEIEDRQLTIAPDKIHHLMAYADLFIGDSSTMTSESALLGTPAIYVSTICLGYTDELQTEYGLVFNFSGERRQVKAVRKASSILETYDDSKWKQLRKQLLAEKVDTSSIIIDKIKEAADG